MSVVGAPCVHVYPALVGPLVCFRGCQTQMATTATSAPSRLCCHRCARRWHPARSTWATAGNVTALTAQHRCRAGSCWMHLRHARAGGAVISLAVAVCASTCLRGMPQLIRVLTHPGAALARSLGHQLGTLPGFACAALVSERWAQLRRRVSHVCNPLALAGRSTVSVTSLHRGTASDDSLCSPARSRRCAPFRSKCSGALW